MSVESEALRAEIKALNEELDFLKMLVETAGMIAALIVENAPAVVDKTNPWQNAWWHLAKLTRPWKAAVERWEARK